MTDLADIRVALAAASMGGLEFIPGSRRWLAELCDRVENAEALAERLANRLGGYAMNMQADLDPLFQALGKVNAILDPDWRPETAGEWEINAERVAAIRAVLRVGE